MGMAALAMKIPGTERGGRVDYQRIGIRRLRELARQSHPQHTDEAPRAFVLRALDMEVERRTVHRHSNMGWHNHSPMAPGIAPGGTDIAREPLADQYDRGIAIHREHEFARAFIASARLSPRQLLAVLIQAAKTDRRVPGPWGANYDQIVTELSHYAHMLGFDGGVAAGKEFYRVRDVECQRQTLGAHERVTVPRDADERQRLAERFERGQKKASTRREHTRHQVAVFKDAKALRNAASEGRTQLILLAQA